jgi:hypothetical protein
MVLMAIVRMTKPNLLPLGREEYAEEQECQQIPYVVLSESVRYRHTHELNRIQKNVEILASLTDRYNIYACCNIDITCHYD